METSLLIAITLGLFLLPLLPAFNEWWHPKDDKPLRVVQEYDGNVRHFAQGFRQYLAAQFANRLSDNVTHTYNDTLADGTLYQVVGSDEGVQLSRVEQQKKRVRHITVSQQPLLLPDDIVFEKEIYSAGDITTGYKNYLRALLSDGNIDMHESGKILRWMHAEGNILVASGCELFGRASAEGMLTLADGCLFERLHAARVVFGSMPADIDWTDGGDLPVIDDLDNVLDYSGNRWLIAGNLQLDDRQRLNGDVVTRGDCVIGNGSYIDGSLKSSGDMRVGADTVVKGSLVSAKHILIGENCRLHGPVIAERAIVISRGTVVGAYDIPTTITAPEIFVDREVLAHGTVWASARGLVKTLQEAA